MDIKAFQEFLANLFSPLKEGGETTPGPSLGDQDLDASLPLFFSDAFPQNEDTLSLDEGPVVVPPVEESYGYTLSKTVWEDDPETLPELEVYASSSGDQLGEGDESPLTSEPKIGKDLELDFDSLNNQNFNDLNPDPNNFPRNTNTEALPTSTEDPFTPPPLETPAEEAPLPPQAPAEDGPTEEPPTPTFLTGTAGDDVIYAFGDNNVVEGGDGYDTLYAYGNNNTLQGGKGYDTLYSFGEDNILEGGGGRDKIYGSEGSDYIDGGAGKDFIYAGGGDDTAVYDPLDLAFDMGEGRDTVKIFSQDVDLSTFFDVVSNAEIIDLDGGSSVKIDSAFLSSEKAAALGELTINGVEGSTVEMGADFQKTGETTQDGHSYTVYDNGTLTVAVESDVTVIVP